MPERMPKREEEHTALDRDKTREELIDELRKLINQL